MTSFLKTRFFSSIMVLKLGAESGADFDPHKNPEDDAASSEAGFMKYLQRNPQQVLTKTDLNKLELSYKLSNAGLAISELKIMFSAAGIRSLTTRITPAQEDHKLRGWVGVSRFEEHDFHA